jgi:DNA-directed RNA polymerase specialized sigma24 family protein
VAVSMLADVVTLHDPSCSGECRPSYCISDLEALCRDVLNDHLAEGVRTSGGISGPTKTLTPSEYDDALCFLIGTGWEAWQRFNPVDDGRGSNRVAGYATWILHRRVVDWRRRTFGYARNGTARQLVEYDPRQHDAVHWDPELGGGREIDAEAMSVEGRAALEMVRPLFGDEELSQGELAARLGVPKGKVSKGVSLVRRELKAQGFGRVPSDTICTVVERA